ncbi:non-ribosomal peptide synthetase [Sulfitobacter sp.]|uniref:non-ribosomal peptide synthetase n=1 Tax=Sulfitobacter sp. TaxID=1903071 RepID=UPI00300174BA
MQPKNETSQTSGVPLTPMQLGLISESIGSEQPWINLEQVILHFGKTSVSAEAVKAGLLALAMRHDALRVMIQRNAVGRLNQLLRMPVHAPLEVIEKESTSNQSWLEELEKFLAEDRNRGFDLVGGTMWRASLVRCEGRHTTIVLTMHHAIADGRSMARLAQELIEYLQTGALPPADADAITFEDFCRVFSGTVPNEEAAVTYFRTYLKDFEDAGTLHFSEGRKTELTANRKQQVSANLTVNESKNLQKAASLLGGTTANIVQAAWGILLSRWQGREAVTFGVVRSGRHALPNCQTTVGCLINTLPTCVKLSPDLMVSSLVSALRKHTLSLRTLEQTPADLIRRSIGLHGAKPLFETAIMFENGEIESLVTSGEETDVVEKIELREEGGMPLMLSVYADDAARIQLEYDPSAVSKLIAERMLAHLIRLMHALSLSDKTTKVATLDMLECDERDTLLDWSTPDAPLEIDATCLVQLFQNTVQNAPDASAVEMIGEVSKLTFAELDQQSDQLARVLLEHGALPGEIVAINLSRSVNFIVAVLATLKTGAAFMPVDPAHPEASRAHMISDSAAQIIVQNDVVVRGQRRTPIPRDLAPDAKPIPRPPENINALAYVIYTSGSTGTPKGVRVTRGNLLAHLAALTKAFELKLSDRALQFAGLSFDVAIEEIFTTLMSGATLVLRSEEMSESTSVFLDEIDAEKLNFINLPTAYWTVLNRFMQTSGRSLPPLVRLVVVGGEEIASRTLSEWLKVAPDARFLNGYGPTEATITCTLFEPINHQPGEDVCIGRPTAHSLAYVIAPDGSLAPKGVLGELAIGGPAISQGYIGRPDETAQAFRPNGFTGSGNIYCTGDRVQWRDGGNLQFRGRQDRQIKLRGHRIELAHIERAVEQCIPEGEILCDVLNKNTLSAQLVVWIASQRTLDLDAINESVADLLPTYMRPTLVDLPQFPRTQNGKIDRTKLPQPVQVQSPSEGQHTAATELEIQICQIMAKVLNIPRVEIDQSFFDLGGHSLLSLELIGRIAIETGKPLGIVDFRNHPSPRELGEVLGKGGRKSKYIIPIQPLGSKAPLFAIHILGQNEEYFRPLAQHLGLDQPVLGISVGSLDADTLTGVEFTAARYCKEINQHFPDGPIHLMAASLGSYIAFELAQQLQASGRTVDTLAFFDAAGPDGRVGVRGIGKIGARIRRAQYIGWRYPALVFENLIYEMRNKVARYLINRESNDRQRPSPKTVIEFIASNELAVNDYTPQPISIPLTIFRSKVNFHDTEETRANGLGWASVANNGFSVIDVPGGHLSMLQEPHVFALANEIKEDLKSD